jgi:hypothetical protein
MEQPAHQLAAMRVAFVERAGALDSLDHVELLAVLDQVETLVRQLPSIRHHALARLQEAASPTQVGAKNWREALKVRWRLSGAEAGRWLRDAALLGPRRTLTGQPMAPVLATTAAAQSNGAINAEHVDVIRKAMKKIPAHVDAATRDHAEADLAEIARTQDPVALGKAADRVVTLLDQDGPEPDDTERARKRSVTKNRQNPDQTVEVHATLTPKAWAVVETLFAKFAAPGMCNTDDDTPCTTGTPSQTQITTDTRTLGQRQHDALEFIGRTALSKTELGHHNGLPTTIVVRTTLHELLTRSGIGVTGGGTTIPIDDVLQMAAESNTHNFLAVFDHATGSALNLYRTRRTASVAQRLMLIARDGGCTKPGCTVPAYGCQVHHVVADFADGGNTNVDDNGLACGGNNREVRPGGWTTRMTARHEVEWIPPPHLDTGQARINHYHRPEELLRPKDEGPSESNAPPPGGTAA